MQFGLVTGKLEAIRAAGGWGFDYVEVMGALLLPLEPDAAWRPRRRELEDTGARISNLAGFIGGEARFVGPVVDWGRTRGYVETVVGRGAELGVDVFNWGSPMSKSVPVGWPYSRAFEQVERAAHLIADVVGQHDATCVIEPINPGECNIMYYVTDGMMLAASVNRPQIRCLADFFHMSLQCEPLAHVVAAKEWLAHAHTAGPRRLLPNEGQAWEQRRFMRALREAGYDGRLSVEAWTVRDGSTFGDDAAESARYLRRLRDEVWAEAPVSVVEERDYQWWPP
jgi:D-psicose/D-tagatose/L-ribulose 3-epimerase